METAIEVMTTTKTERTPHTPAFAAMHNLNRIQALQAESDVLRRTLNDAKRPRLLRSSVSTLPADQEHQYRSRIADIEREIGRLGKVGAALAAGYDPYTPPADWIVGMAEPERWEKDRRLRNLSLYFNAPMPPEVLAKWKDARDADCFDAFCVAAPDPSLFAVIQDHPSVRSLMVDPVLIGYCSTGQDGWLGTPGTHLTAGFRMNRGIVAHNMCGFMIAHWDLENDLEYLLNH